MARRVPVGRLVAWGAVAGLLGASAYFAADSHRKQRQVREWFLAEPARVAVDLSRPGVTTAPLRQTCAVAHGEFLELWVEEAPKAPARPASALLAGLAGRVELRDRAGQTVSREPLPTFAYTDIEQERPIRLSGFHPLPPVGEYTLRIEVTRGAPALAGMRQTVIARYLLCGMEGLPALFSAFSCLLTGVPGMILGGVLAWRAIRGRRRAPTPTLVGNP